MLALVLCLAALSPAAAQLFPSCSNYQSTTDFTQEYVDQMRAEEGGYIVRLSNGDQLPCQRLQFVDGNDFNYTFFDITSEAQNYTDRYSISFQSPTAPAKLHLTLPAGMLGSGSLSSGLTLVPLLAKPDVLVLVSCRAFGVSINEQVLVLSPFKKQNATSTLDVMSMLRTSSIPKVDDMKNVSTNCEAQPPANSTSLALEIYRVFMDRFQIPFAAMQDAMTPDTLAVRNTPQEIADQVLRIFSSVGISPAQIIAARNEFGQQGIQAALANAEKPETAPKNVVPAASEQRNSATPSQQVPEVSARSQSGIVYTSQPSLQLVQSLPSTNYFRALGFPSAQPTMFVAPQGFTAAKARSADAYSNQVFLQPASEDSSQTYFKF